MQQFSISQIAPLLNGSPFVGAGTFSRLYAILQIEPLRALSLDVLKMLKECYLLHLLDSSRYTSAMIHKSAQHKQCNQIRKAVQTVLKLINKVSEQAEAGSMGAGEGSD